jgi:hypothetical protein
VLVEEHLELGPGWLVGGDVVVAASQVLDKRVTGSEDPS